MVIILLILSFSGCAYSCDKCHTLDKGECVGIDTTYIEHGKEVCKK